MSSDPWSTDQLDLTGYLARLGAPAPPDAAALAELHEAHVRTFTFDNIDVLLGQHPGVSLWTSFSTSSWTAVAAATASSTTSVSWSDGSASEHRPNVPLAVLRANLPTGWGCVGGARD
ncbi:hypothetical protein [Nocardioides endophyticus]